MYKQWMLNGLYLCCFCVMIWQIATYLLEALEDPIHSTVTVEHLNSVHLASIVVCGDQWYTHGAPENFPVGYLLNSYAFYFAKEHTVRRTSGQVMSCLISAYYIRAFAAHALCNSALLHSALHIAHALCAM